MNARPDGERRDEDEEVGAKRDDLDDQTGHGEIMAEACSASADGLQTGARGLDLQTARARRC